MAGVLLFGGSFDPIHHGHLLVARAAAEQLGVGRVVLIPGAAPPHKLDKRLAPAAQRVAMCRLAVVGDPLFAVSDWEVSQAGPNYTLLTVQRFRAASPEGTELYWLIGMDSLRELRTWYRIAELVAACTVVTAGRPGVAPPELEECLAMLPVEAREAIGRHILNTPLIEISATEVRARARAGQSLRYLVPDAVAAYIETHGLYRAAPASG